MSVVKQEFPNPPGNPLDSLKPPLGSTDFTSNQTENPFAMEPNPFEQSFAPKNLSSGSNDSNSKNSLPPVSSIASPGGALGTPGFSSWANSLRAGPLSPAILSGPQSLLDPSMRTNLTPNESGIRTGLTPGGSGSMFPAASPTTAALFGLTDSGGGQTPSIFNGLSPRPQNVNGNSASMNRPDASYGDQDSAAANGLFLLSQSQQQQQRQQQQQQLNSNAMPATMQPDSQRQSETPTIKPDSSTPSDADSATEQKPGTRKRSSSSAVKNDIMSGEVEHKSPSRMRRGRAAAKSSTPHTNSNNTSEDTPSSMKSNKRRRNVRQTKSDDESESSNERSKDPKKQAEEDKRKNFLERNRIAALKCRQRKKQWLANLQNRVEYFTAENENLNAQIHGLQEQVVNLKSLLLAHKDCSASQIAPIPETLTSLGQDWQRPSAQQASQLQMAATQQTLGQQTGLQSTQQAPPGTVPMRRY